eukprot:40898_1
MYSKMKRQSNRQGYHYRYIEKSKVNAYNIKAHLTNLGKHKFPNDLVYGVLFSNQYRLHVMNIIHTLEMGLFGIDTIYRHVLPLLQQSDEYVLYKDNEPLIKFSLLKLCQHFVKKKLLHQIASAFPENTPTFCICVERFNDYRNRLLKNRSIRVPHPVIAVGYDDGGPVTPSSGSDSLSEDDAEPLDDVQMCDNEKHCNINDDEQSEPNMLQMDQSIKNVETSKRVVGVTATYHKNETTIYRLEYRPIQGQPFVLQSINHVVSTSHKAIPYTRVQSSHEAKRCSHSSLPLLKKTFYHQNEDTNSRALVPYNTHWNKNPKQSFVFDGFFTPNVAIKSLPINSLSIRLLPILPLPYVLNPFPVLRIPLHCYNPHAMIGYRRHQIQGTTFFNQFGDKIEDYKFVEVPVSYFRYNQMQHTLICCECDFSFTRWMITNRGDCAVNLCSTALFDYSTNRPLPHLVFCRSKGCKITFDVSAIALHCTEKRWNDRYGATFDRIVYTFPRIYQAEWDKIYYNQQNQRLICEILKSAKKHLSESGEIHLMLFKEQFNYWRIYKALQQCGLKLMYWAVLDRDLLDLYFSPYTPMDLSGNLMKINQDHIIYFCSFTIE